MAMNWDYIAGFFDGEGNLELHFKNQNGNPNYHNGITINISQKTKPVLDEIGKFLVTQGIKRISFNHRFKPNINEIWYIAIHNRMDAEIFLNNIKDKVIVKKLKVDMVLEYFATHKWKQTDRFQDDILTKLLTDFDNGMPRKDIIVKYKIYGNKLRHWLQQYRDFGEQKFNKQKALEIAKKYDGKIFTNIKDVEKIFNKKRMSLNSVPIKHGLVKRYGNGWKIDSSGFVN